MRDQRNAKRIANIAGGVAVAVLAATAAGQVQFDDLKLLSDDLSQGDQFGSEFSIDGEHALVSAHQRNELGSRAGAAYIFDVKTWDQVAKLMPSDLEAGDYFGRSVAMSGPFVAVGAPFHDDFWADDAGAVYIFNRDGAQLQKLTPSSPQHEENFGRYMAMDGDRMAIAATGRSEGADQSGAIYIFEHRDGSWFEEAIVSADDAQIGDGIGRVALEGDVLAVSSGGISDHGINSGAAYVFELIDGEWEQVAKLYDDDPGQLKGFGGSGISLSNGVLLVAAAGNDRDGMQNAGAVFAFEKIDGEWEMVQMIESPEVKARQEFGSSVAHLGDYAIIGASSDDEFGTWAGAGYLFERVDGVWEARTKMAGSDTGQADFLGLGSGISETTVLLGAQMHAHDGMSSSGAAYVFSLEAEPCIADWNGDGEVDINDFFAYLDDFEAGDPRADLNNDGEIDINDFFIFLDEFEAGC